MLTFIGHVFDARHCAIFYHLILIMLLESGTIKSTYFTDLKTEALKY